MSTTNSRNMNYATALKNPSQYSQALQSPTFPKREQAIILNVNENLILDDYMSAVGNIVGPENVRAISRISNNRICIFLSSIQAVENFVITHENIEIKGYNIGVRRLITPAKRVILSNVCPSIPHSVLENLIKSIGYKTASSVSFLRIGTSNPLYNHVISFRRQVYVLPNNDIELPSSMQITYENVSYRVFLTFDVLTCFLCKNTGHIANQCPQQTPQNNTANTEDRTSQNNLTNKENNTGKNGNIGINNKETDAEAMETTSTQREKHISQHDRTDLVSLDISDSSQTIDQNPKETKNKRPASSIASISTEHVPDSPTNQLTEESIFTVPKNTHKKLKQSKSQENSNTLHLLKSVQKHIEEKSPPYVLNYIQLASLFENLPGSEDKISLIKTYSDDLEPLLTMLFSIHPYLDKSMKTRNTQLQKRIRNYLLAGEGISDSELSISSQT